MRTAGIKPFALSLSIFVWCSNLSAQLLAQFVVADSGLHSSLGVNDAGRVTVVWQNGPVYFRQFDSLGNAITDSIRLSSWPMTDFPAITPIGDSWMCVWKGLSPSFNSYILGRLIDPQSIPEGADILLNDDYWDAERGSEQITELTDSTYGVVWSGGGPQTITPPTGIYGQLLTTEMVPIGSNVFLNDAPLDDYGTHPTLATHPVRKRVFIAWYDKNTHGNKIRGRFYDKTLQALAPSMELVSDTSFYKCVWSPRAAMDSTGTIWLCWSSEIVDKSWQVFLQQLTETGEPIGNAVRVNRVPAGNGAEVRLSLNEEGKCVVVWESKEGSLTGLRGQRYDHDGTAIGGDFLVTPLDDTASSIFPELVFTRNRIYVTWQTGYHIRARFFDFNDAAVQGVETAQEQPKTFVLRQNYPNPFNPSTSIVIVVNNTTQAILDVFDLFGREVVVLHNGSLLQGHHLFVWDGRDSQRMSVSSGVYYCRLATPHRVDTIKMILLH